MGGRGEMMAPWRVSTPAKGVPVADGMTGRTPDLVVDRRTGGGGGASITWDWAEARATKPAAKKRLCILIETLRVALVVLMR